MLLTFSSFIRENTELVEPLQSAMQFQRGFLSSHPELKGRAYYEEPTSFMATDSGRICMGADVYYKTRKLGELGFDLSYRPETQKDAPLVAVIQHFYKDVRLGGFGKGVMSTLLENWLEGVKKLGVKHIIIVGGTAFWNKPAKAHPEFEWTGYNKL